MPVQGSHTYARERRKVIETHLFVSLEDGLRRVQDRLAIAARIGTQSLDLCHGTSQLTNGDSLHIL